MNKNPIRSTKTIPELLVITRGNQAAVARILHCNRGTVAKYISDTDAERHIIVNGQLMVDASGKGHGKCRGKLADEPVVTSRGIGLTAWLGSDNTGQSSKFMASVLSHGQFTAPNNYPHDPADFGRCIQLIEAVPEYKGLIHLMCCHGHEWEAVANNWEQWVELFNSGDVRKLYSAMKSAYAKEQVNEAENVHT